MIAKLLCGRECLHTLNLNHDAYVYNNHNSTLIRIVCVHRYCDLSCYTGDSHHMYDDIVNVP